MALTVSDLPMIYGLLANSVSSDVNVLKPAEDALAQLESRPGFCSCLMVFEVIFLVFIYECEAVGFV